jgi:zinc transport system substrate-binding protein
MCRRIPSIFLALLTLLLSVISGCGSGQSAAAASAKPVVLCSIFSYYDAARAIAGDRLDVQILLPPSASPHEYETTPHDRILASRAALYIKNGLGLDDHFDKLLSGSKATILDISQKIPKNLLVTTDELSLDTGPATGTAAGSVSSNPHIWLDPHIQIQAAQIIRDALIDLDPAGKATFEKNAKEYIDDLNQLDHDFAAAAAGFKNKDFIGFHSAYDYLAHRYGLRQIASIEEIPGNGLSPAQQEKIINLLREKNIHYIAVETALPEQGINSIVRQTGARTIVLQPLETYDNKDDTYLKLMRQNLESLKTALGA